MKAAWRMFEYEMTRRDTSVSTLTVHLKDQNYVTFEEDDVETIEAAKEQLSQLDLYFLRPLDADFDDLTYPEYHKNYQVTKTGPKSIKKTWNDQAPNGQQHVVYRRTAKHVTRLQSVRMQQGEGWYLRILLRFVSARSYEQLKTVSIAVLWNYRYSTKIATA